jgi:hypothetical protein
MAGNVLVKGLGAREGATGGGTAAAEGQGEATSSAAAAAAATLACDQLQVALIDFADCGHGDPLYDFVAVFTSALNCDMTLFKACFRSYCESVDIAALWPHRGRLAAWQVQQQQQEQPQQVEQQQEVGVVAEACGIDQGGPQGTGIADATSCTHTDSSSKGNRRVPLRNHCVEICSHEGLAPGANRDTDAARAHTTGTFTSSSSSSGGGGVKSGSCGSKGRVAVHQGPAGPVARAFMTYVLLHEEEPAVEVLAAAPGVRRGVSSWEEVAAELFGWMDEMVMVGADVPPIEQMCRR